METCLNCEFEPVWGEPVGKEYVRRTGICRWSDSNALQPLPKTFTRHEVIIVRYDDDSGVMSDCPCWREAQKQSSEAQK